MKKFFLMTTLLLSAIAAKAEQVWVGIDSVTWSNITVTSVTATRVDNLVLGTTGQVLVGRNQIIMTIPSGSAKINCNYYIAAATSSTQVSLSTQSNSANLGTEFATTATQSLQIPVPLPSSMSYWCQGQGATNPTIHIDQTRPFKALFGN